MKIKTTLPIIIALIILSMCGCEKKTDWKLKTNELDLIVVDGLITNEQKSHSIKLTSPVTEPNQTPTPITGAIVTIIETGTIWTLTETPSGSGLYLTPSNFRGYVGREYTLNISYNGKVITASTHMTPLLSFEEYTAFTALPDSMYRLQKVTEDYHPLNTAMWEITVDWSHIPKYHSTNPDSCKALILRYSLPTIDINEIFAPTAEVVLLPKGARYQKKKYSLSPEYAEFIRAMIFETKWQGGIFNSTSSNIPTNLSEGGIGYFAACVVDSLPVKKIVPNP